MHKSQLSRVAHLTAKNCCSRKFQSLGTGALLYTLTGKLFVFCHSDIRVMQLVFIVSKLCPLFSRVFCRAGCGLAYHLYGVPGAQLTW